MAKKARQRLDDPEAKPFEFPEFDIPKFLHHEFEQTYATVVAFGLAILIAIVSFGLSLAKFVIVVPFGVGIALLVVSPFVLQRLRPRWTEYTRGEWAGLIAVELFGWIGLWFLFADVFH